MSAVADTLFPSDDESSTSSEVDIGMKKAVSSKKRPVPEPIPSTSASSSSSKKAKKPAPAISKPSAHDLFGSDSDDPEPEPKKGRKTNLGIHSYFTRRLANGHSRQTNDAKVGSHYVEIKVYKCDEIRSVLPVNRWRHAIVAIKNQVDVDSDTWRKLSELITITRKDFKKCTPTFISNFY